MSEDKFKLIWSYRPVDYRTWPSLSSPQRQQLTLSLGVTTTEIKLWFTNQNGVTPLTLEHLILSIIRDGQTIAKLPINFKQHNKLTLDLDEDAFSDGIVFDFLAEDQLKVSIDLPKKTYLSSGVVTYSLLGLTLKNTFLKDSEDYPQSTSYKMVQENPRMSYFFGICGILAKNVDSQVVTMFGDSITQQGFFVNHTRQLLQQNQPGHFAVNNCGIGGNRILYDTDPAMDKWYRHGIAGVKRFEDDVFGLSEPDLVFVFHGINDVIQETIHPGEVEAVQDIIKGLTKYAEIIKKYHAKSLIGTLLPLRNSIFYSEAIEEKRQRVNAWIRSQKIYDTVVDLEVSVKDAHEELALSQDCDSGDGLHPSDYGGEVIAKTLVASILALETNK